MRGIPRLGQCVGCLFTLLFGIVAGCSTNPSPSPSATSVGSSQAIPSPPSALSIPTTVSLASAPSRAIAATRLDTTYCPFAVPLGSIQGKTVDCGFVTVPERRSRPDGPTIRVAVARFHSLSDTPDPVPVVELSGGPGARNQGLVYGFRSFFSGVSATHDVVVFD